MSTTAASAAGTRAVGVVEYGGPEALREVEVAPEPVGPGQVRIRVTAAAVNPTDTLVRNGSRNDRTRAEGVADVPGMDAAGVVTELGADVTEVAVGERVMAIVVPAGEHGAYREDLVVPIGSVVAVPAGASDAEAATLPMNGLTARLALDSLGLHPGQVVAVTGAAGAFGGYAVELAKADGLVVVADAALDSAGDEELVRRLGADHVVPRGEDVARAIRGLFPDGVDGLADGSVQDAAVLPAVKDGGAVATVRGYAGDGTRDLRVTPVMVRDVAEDRAALDRLREQAEKGELTLRVADVLPASRATEAHQRLEAGGVRGRLVLDLG